MHIRTARSFRAVGRRTSRRPPAPGSLPLALLLLVLGILAGAGARAETTATSRRPVLATTPATHALARPAPASPPEDLRDLAAWLDYRTRNHLASLPLEARYFYRQGLLQHEAGEEEEANRSVRGAAELDPNFVAPRLTLASWLLLHEPNQALLQYATVVEVARDNFLFQLALAGDALHLILLALFLGFLGAGLILVALHNHELRHAWAERIGRQGATATARWWAWGLLLLPFVAGFGLAVPTLVLLALLRPSLRGPERGVMFGLLAVVVALPWAAGSLERLSVPLLDDRAPYHGVPLVVTETLTADRATRLEEMARREPDSPFLQFAAAWTARHRGDLAAAESGYRRALDLWPEDDRVLNNLGNVLAMQGRQDEALTLYQRAGRVNPSNAAAPFNASQIFTQRFDYHAATDALSRASALNFDLVKSYQSQATDDGVLPLADEWVAPHRFWAALPLRAATGGRGALPPAWRACIECSGWPFTLATGLLTILALVLGGRLNRALPLRSCSNCGAVICRRCARRRRETALCHDCATAEAGADAPDFARVLLHKRRREVRARRRHLQVALALLVPGYGLLAYRRAAPALLLLCVGAALAGVTLADATPFWYEPRPALTARALPIAALAAAWLALYTASFLGFLARRARADAEEAAAAAPVRSRIRLSNRDRSVLAA
jgi:hypothetical protein